MFSPQVCGDPQYLDAILELGCEKDNFCVVSRSSRFYFSFLRKNLAFYDRSLCPLCTRQLNHRQSEQICGSKVFNGFRKSVFGKRPDSGSFLFPS